MNTLFSNGICRMAVPIFFLISGYLLMYRLNITKNKKEYIKNYFKRLIKLYIIWTIIYLPIIITRLITNKYGLISDFMIFLEILYLMVLLHIYGISKILRLLL